MSRRHAGYLVTLREDLGDDMSERVLDAIRLLGPVLSVTPIEGGAEQAMADERARASLGSKVLDVIYPERSKR